LIAALDQPGSWTRRAPGSTSGVFGEVTMTTTSLNAGPMETDTRRPVLLVVDDDEATRCPAVEALVRRFGADYQVLTAGTPREGLDVLERLAGERVEVTLIAADLGMSEMDGVEFLGRAHALHPDAARALLIGIDDTSADEPIQRGAALGQFDFTLSHGWVSPEEWLYPQVQDALTAWTKVHRPHREMIKLVGEQWSPRSHELRDILTRNSIPFGFYGADSDHGRQLLTEHGMEGAQLPAAILWDGRAFANPSNADIADALGVRTRPDAGVYDVAIVGAGPAGLTAAVYSASEGLRTLVVEAVAHGGQAGTSSMIRNYPGFPRGVSGGELAARAYEQAVALGAQFVFTNRATGLAVRGRERVLTFADGSEASCRAVVIATGVAYRRLGIPALDQLIGMGVFYGGAATEAPAMAGQNVCVIGGANSAGQAALHLARFAARVTLLVRGESLAAGMSDYLIKTIRVTPNIEVRMRTSVVDGHGKHRLETVVREDLRTGRREEMTVAAIFVMIGAEPHTGWLREVLQRDGAGYVLTGGDVSSSGWPLDRPPMLLETSVPGVFAVGDVRKGSAKRVAAAVGDGSVAAGFLHTYLGETR
jgi:thioredoxin reductase (NADPH)